MPATAFLAASNPLLTHALSISRHCRFDRCWRSVVVVFIFFWPGAFLVFLPSEPVNTIQLQTQSLSCSPLKCLNTCIYWNCKFEFCKAYEQFKFEESNSTCVIVEICPLSLHQSPLAMVAGMYSTTEQNPYDL